MLTSVVLHNSDDEKKPRDFTNLNISTVLFFVNTWMAKGLAINGHILKIKLKTQTAIFPEALRSSPASITDGICGDVKKREKW